MVFPRSVVWYGMVVWSMVFADASAVSGIETGSRGHMLQPDVLATISQLLTAEVQPSSSTRCNDSLANNHMVSERCRLDVCKFEEALEENERYALEMMDSMGRFPAGLMKGNFQWIGTRTECVRATLDPKSAFRSKYCLTGYDIPFDNETAMSDAISIGICVPESCTEEEVRLLLLDGDLPTPPIGVIGAIFPLSYVYCSYHKSLTTGAIVVICLSVSLLFLVVCGSGYEYYEMKMTQKTQKQMDHNSEPEHSKTDAPATERENQDKSTWKELLLSFSAISNGYRILDAKSVDHGEHTMTVLYGFRALTLWWVFLGQTFSINARFMYNFFDIRVILELIFSQASMNYRYAEDSFFLLSGLLITYYSLTRLHTEGKENWFYFYIHRIWRLSAPYFLAFFGYIYLIEYFCTGPFQRHLHEDLQGCYDNWWSYVLYFNNLYPFPGNINTACIPWFWFMACLMQFYIISPPIIYLLYRWIHVGIATIAVLIGVCIACTTVIAYHHDMPVSVSQMFNGYLDMSDPASVSVMDDYIETSRTAG
ncbi:nose resistant to fluoxetine protein 6-like [Ptychodera flava]|uniref:nose resistant to fluoxetine protein 6-like n=1 Tax=Ptychodera flava TaxID=63121 RepID=UPI003969F80B